MAEKRIRLRIKVGILCNKIAVVVVAAAADAVADVVIVVVVLMRVEHGWMVAAGRVKPDRVVSLRKLRHDWSNIIFLKN